MSASEAPEYWGELARLTAPQGAREPDEVMRKAAKLAEIASAYERLQAQVAELQANVKDMEKWDVLESKAYNELKTENERLKDQVKTLSQPPAKTYGASFICPAKHCDYAFTSMEKLNAHIRGRHQ